MTPTSKPLVLSAAFSTAYSVASLVTGFLADMTLGLVATVLLLGGVVWSEHVAHERERRASEGLWGAAYRHDLWSRRADGEVGR